MTAINFILNIIQMVVFAGLTIVVVVCIAGLVLGLLGVGLCDIEYDEEDDRPPYV